MPNFIWDLKHELLTSKVDGTETNHTFISNRDETNSSITRKIIEIDSNHKIIKYRVNKIF